MRCVVVIKVKMSYYLCLTFNIWYVLLVLLVIKYGFIISANHWIMFLHTTFLDLGVVLLETVDTISNPAVWERRACWDGSELCVPKVIIEIAHEGFYMWRWTSGILNSIADVIESQWRDAMIGEMWAWWLILIRAPAAVFWISCSSDSIEDNLLMRSISDPILKQQMHGSFLDCPETGFFLFW